MPTDPTRITNKFMYGETALINAAPAVSLTAGIMVGYAGGQPWELNAGENITIRISNPAMIYVRSIAGVQRVNELD